ncbi:hypothetical protein [Erythrobacter sp. THAF29]|uniref:hypothetical protein n=1 Tax=Erythrobacter sp. THAF29 TaxID=2587851 RepID=UPI0012692C28|nr:hypothetical protein [Erythrobacter sp. THAF29]QFT78138.1 hypothetical protein FIU90_11365 [Erythrobacter sp. THAF29]
MTASERFFAILQRVTLVLFLITPLALLWWIGQSIAGNFARQALIEEKDFGSLREKLDEDFAGKEIRTLSGNVLVYEFSKNQDLDDLNYDQVSDVTLVHSKTGNQRKISGDERKVIWFQTVKSNRPEEPDTADENESVDPPAFAYVARLATRDMYKKGVSDLVVGNLETLAQRQIAEGVPFVDSVGEGPEKGQVALVYWDSPDSARFALVSSDTLEILRTEQVELPAASSFLLDLQLDQTIDRDEAIEKAVQAAARRPKPKPRPDSH